MVKCAEMKEGDRFLCETCGLELKVVKSCNCGAGEDIFCTILLQCCGKDMVKR